MSGEAQGQLLLLQRQALPVCAWQTGSAGTGVARKVACRPCPCPAPALPLPLPQGRCWAGPASPGPLPLCDAPVSSDHGRLDVDGVVPHASQLQCFIQRPNHIQCIMSLCEGHSLRISGGHGAIWASSTRVCQPEPGSLGRGAGYSNIT